MIEIKPGDAKANSAALIGSQPIALAAVTFLVVVAGVVTILLWRTYTGTSPEVDRIAASRQLQVKTAQVSEQLVEKTKNLAATQQESIDDLQVVQDQLQTVKRQLAAQQADNRRLSEQVANLTGAIDSLRQSFASAQSEITSQPAARVAPHRAKVHATRTLRRKHAKSRG